MNLDALRRRSGFYADTRNPQWVATLWPSKESFNWFWRCNKPALIVAGVAIKYGRDWLLDIEKLESFARAQLAHCEVSA